MDSESAAASAIQSLNGADMKGRKMKVELSVGGARDDRRGKNTQKLFIGNVADGTTDQQLRELFEPLCKVVEADVIDGKNFGFVHVDVGTAAASYTGRQKIEEIIGNLSGASINGNQLRIQASTSSGRNQQGGGYRGGGYGGGNNGSFRGGRGRGMSGGGGRGGRGRGRQAPYPQPRGYDQGGFGGYDGYGEDSRDYYGGGGGGPMRGSDNYSYGDYSGGGGSNDYYSDGYSEQMYSRRPAAYKPRGGGGYGGGSGPGQSSSSMYSSYSAPPPPPQSYGYAGYG